MSGATHHRTLASAAAAAALITLAGCNGFQPGIYGGEPEEQPDLVPMSAPGMESRPTRIIVGEQADGPYLLDAPLAVQPFAGGLTGLPARAPRLDVEAPAQPTLPEVGSPIDTLVPADRYRHGELCTYGADLWGAECDDATPLACLRDQKFDAWFPRGLVAGVGDHQLRITSAAAVMAALPAEGPAKPLTADLVDPEAAELGELAGEIVTLKLNIALSHAGVGTQSLESAMIAGGPFEGWGVGALVRFAEEVLGGTVELTSADLLQIDDLVDEVAAINAGALDCRPADYLRKFVP